jgi:hypothetical protein
MPDPAFRTNDIRGFGPSADLEGIVRDPYAKTYPESDTRDMGRNPIPGTDDANIIYELPERKVRTNI